jgi:hypothetical protein
MYLQILLQHTEALKHTKNRSEWKCIIEQAKTHKSCSAEEDEDTEALLSFNFIFLNTQ